jgi:apolipoprotein N-acyltransferase
MGFVYKLNRAAVALLVMAATATLLFFANGLIPLWPLMWIAPLPVLWFALRRPAWQAGLAAGGAWFAGCLNLWSYMRVLGAPHIVWLLDFATVAAAFAAGVLLTRELARRGLLWSAWLALPAVWTTFEYGRNLIWPHGSAGCVAYSQLKFLPFLQTASLVGPWGMGFVLMLFPVGLALSIDRWRSERSRALRILAATLGLVSALLIFGVVRLAIPQPGPDVTVGLVASDTNGGNPVENPGPPTEQLFQTYAREAKQLIAEGAQVVVMPENMGVVLDSTAGKTDAIFQPIANQTGAVLVVGMAHISSTMRRNQARIYAPYAPVRSYDKEHLLPPFETDRFSSGTTRTLFTPPGEPAGQIWAVAICKDLDLTDPARAYGQAGVGLMLTPAWDFRVDQVWHGHIAVMRAVDDGFSLVRSARNGLLTVADNRGRIVGEIATNTAPFATLLARLPAGHSRTLFLWLGDWFGWCSVILLIVVLARLVRYRTPNNRSIANSGVVPDSTLQPTP